MNTTQTNRELVRTEAIDNGWTHDRFADFDNYFRDGVMVATQWAIGDQINTMAQINRADGKGWCGARPRMAIVTAREWLSEPAQARDF